MKSVTLFLSLLLCANVAFAADADLITKIKNKNAEAKNITCTFSQSKHIKMMETPINSNGTLYYESGKMTMIYNEPKDDYLVINDKQFVMMSRGKKLNHNVKEGSPMRTLRNTLIYCVQGDINAIAQECDATVGYEKSGNLHIYTLTQKKKVPRGYSKIVLQFDAATLQLTKMVLYEATGNYTEYTLNKQTLNTTFKATLFQVPPAK